MINILLITVRSDTGGGPKHVFDLVRTLKRKYQNNQITIASPLSEPYGPKFKNLADKHIEIPHRKFCFFKFFFLLIYCKDKNINLVHSHGRGAGYYSRLLGLFGIKVIHTFHGAHFEKTTIGKLKVFLDRVLKVASNKLINVSHDEYKTSLSMGLTDETRACVIPNGIDHIQIKKEYDQQDKVQSRKQFNLPEDATIWGTLSRLTYQKGIDLFLNFKLPKNTIFAIAGEGEDQEKLKKAIPNDLKDRIIFLGNISEPIKFLSALDGYFSSARWEGLPLSVLEAMSCELPCLLSRVDGHRELDGVELYDLNSKDDFQRKLLEINHVELGKKAGNIIKNKYNLELMADKTYELYCHL
ncbi:MAG: glycosyltransferase family 4 protein [Bacteriovoracaceae bacterium]|nr:glycosyltransferase family 4 protein [Bacteriovoracaceae bacterium]